MASNDFTSYPYPEAWNQDQSYLPTTTYADHTYINAPTYDSYQGQQTYAPISDFEFHSHQAFEQSKQRLQAPSPANSTSHSFDYPNLPALSSVSDSGASVHSTISSAMGSPSAQPQSSDWHNAHMYPGIVQQSDSLFATTGFEYESIPVTDKGCVDPSLIQPFSPTPFAGAQFPEVQAQNLPYPAISSPAPHRLSHSREASVRPQGSASPYMRQQSWQSQPYPQYQAPRRHSVSSVHSRQSHHSHTSSEESNKGLCPIATCGRHVKDLKAHMLTHQNERPEKCPIPTCEYHTKGFARKYDKNRHTLTHYKGTMVCGFCPGSGSAAEKSFNRADVFKRHLTSVHGVEQTPPNARRKSPTTANKKPYASNNREVSGMCSTCGNTFASAQDFYEHLDDCVLRVVQQADPSEAINEKLLTEISEDKQVQETMEKHMLPTNVDLAGPTSFVDEEMDDEDDDNNNNDDANDSTYGSGRKTKRTTTTKTSSRITSAGAINKPPKKGLTHSRNGVPLAGPPTAAGKGSKRRKNYPLSWGAAPEQMRMKKRVLCVYDGQRRLWKDDMMLDADHEVRIPLLAHDGGDQNDHHDRAGGAYVTDLDVATLKRAEGVLNATAEEKGPWLPEGELEALMR